MSAMTVTRADHLKWCKERALRELEYYMANEPESACRNAFASISSDLGKHPETEGHSAIMLGLMLMLGGQLSTPEKMRDFINGFN